MVGNGLATIFMSLLYRLPLTSPYSTAGAALLVTSLINYPLAEAIGAYILCALGIMLLGMSGLFGRVMRLIPQPVVMAVLAGVLLRFGLGIFNAIDDAPANPLIIVAMVGVYFCLRRIKFRAPSLGAMIIGIIIIAAAGQLNFAGDIILTPTVPALTMPVFTLNAALSLALPLFALAISSQYAPGQAVLLGNGYDAPINGILTITGAFSALLALLGGHGNVLGALTAAIVVGPESQSDMDKRYASAVASGIWHVVLGLFGMTVFGLFSIFPGVLSPQSLTLAQRHHANALGGAMDNPLTATPPCRILMHRHDFTLFGIGAPFWGLVAGVAVHTLMTLSTRPELCLPLNNVLEYAPHLGLMRLIGGCHAAPYSATERTIFRNARQPL